MGFTARKRHCAQRPLLTMLPSFSTPEAAGSTNTSVGILAGSTPGRFQKPAVSCSKRSATTIHSSLSSPARIRRALAPPTAGFWPKQNSPLISPASMAWVRARNA